MPTKKQLYSVWESQFEFFGGSGQPKQNYEGSSEDNGLASLKRNDTPIIPQNLSAVLDGEKIGTVSWNTETNDINILVSKK